MNTISSDTVANKSSIPNDTPKKVSSFSLNRVLLKAKYSLYSALIFFLFANPETTIVLQKVFGNMVTLVTSSGVITIQGLLINTVLFFVTMLGLMLLPSE
jgi:hypothetical protein